MKLGHHPLILPFYVPSLILSLSQGMLIPVLPLYVLEFDASLWLVGIILSGLPLGMISGDLPAGRFLRHYGQKRTMQTGFVGFCIANVAMYLSDSIGGALIFQFLTGFSFALISVARHAYVTDRSHTSKRGRAIAMFGGLNRFGRFLGPITGGSIGAIYGLPIVFLCVSGTCCVALAVVTFAMSGNGGGGGRQTSNQPVSSFRTVIKLHYRILLSAGAGQLCAQTIRASRLVLIPLFGAQISGLSVAEIGMILSASAAFDMSLFYVAGWLMDTWGRKFAIVPSFSIQAAAFAMIPFCGGFASLMVVSCLIGIGNGLGAGNMMTLGSDLAPSDSPGEFLGVWRLIGDTGHLSAPLLVGNVAEFMTLQVSAMAVSGVGFVAVMFFVFLIPETLVKKQS